MSWEMLWKGLFVVGVSLFAVMAILVTVGGFRDAKRLITELKHREVEDGR